MRYAIILIIGLFVFSQNGYAQYYGNHEPLSINYNSALTQSIEETETDTTLISELQTKWTEYINDTTDTLLYPEYIGYSDTNSIRLNEFTHEEIEIGNENWVIKRHNVSNSVANGISLIFDELYLPDSAYLHIYPTDSPHLSLGNVDSVSFNDSIFLSKDFYSSPSVTIELDYLKSQESMVSLRVMETVLLSSDGLTDSDILDCYLNANCNPYRTDFCKGIRAVIKMRVRQEKFKLPNIVPWSNCSGVLVNNDDGKPYAMTAAHCVTTVYASTESDTVDLYRQGYLSKIFYNFQKQQCNPNSGPANYEMYTAGFDIVDSNGYKYSTGGSFGGSGCANDMALIKLDQRPPFQYNVFYSGWTQNEHTTSDGDVTSFSHPHGAIKKVAHGDFKGKKFLSSCYKVEHDEPYGYIDRGSSGGPLFNDDGSLIGITVSLWKFDTATQCGDEQTSFYSNLHKHWSTFGPYLSDNYQNVYLNSGSDPIKDCKNNVTIRGKLYPAGDWQNNNQIRIQAKNIEAINAQIETSKYIYFKPAVGGDLDGYGDYIFAAENKIKLKRGFVVEKGNHLLCSIEPCSSWSSSCGFNHQVILGDESDDEYILKPVSENFALRNNDDTPDNNKRNRPIIKVYPNPNTGKSLTIELSTEKDSIQVINIIDSEGKIVRSIGDIHNHSHELFPNLEIGIYSMQIKTINSVYFSKLVIQ